MRSLPYLALALLIVGCKPKDDAAASVSTPTGGVAPMTGGAAGGLTPVTGSESVEGSGSGVNQSAIGAAQRAAAKSGPASSVGGGETGGE